LAAGDHESAENGGEKAEHDDGSMQALRRALAALPAGQRLALELAARQKCGIAEIARQSGSSERDVTTAIAEALRALRSAYVKDEVAQVP